MQLKQWGAAGLVLAVAVLAAPASASHIDWEARRAAREAEREAAALVREQERAARALERETARAERRSGDTETDATEPGCTCSARLSFDRPSLQFIGGVLTFIPRVDISISSRGEATDPDWTAVVAHEGSSDYTSADVTVPAGVSFGPADETLSGPCGSSYSLGGHTLGNVPLPGLIRSLLGTDQELDGTVTMRATISGCGFDEEYKQFPFTLTEFGNVSTRSWRTVRN